VKSDRPRSVRGLTKAKLIEENERLRERLARAEGPGRETGGIEEAERLRRELAEALEQQTATSEILRVIASSPTDERPVFETIVGSALRLLDGHSAGLRTLHGNELDISAFTSTTTSGDSALAQGPVAVIPVSSSAHFTRVVKDRTPSVVEDTEIDSGLLPPEHRLVARARGYRSLLTVPLLRGETVLGLINVTRRAPGPFSADDIALLQTFADQAVIAIENVRLFTELEARNRDLTATSEILQVISRSPTDLQPIFDAIVESALRLCDGLYSGVYQVAGDMVHLVAHNHESSEALSRLGEPAPYQCRAR
jgi:GAF domain-containing protein